MTRFVLNGRPVEVETSARPLLDVLRLDLGVTGTKEGCGEGECGACSVLLGDRVVNSCLVPACQVEGETVTTVEGLATNGALHPVQQGFWEKHGLQCGFCTPGMIMTSVQLLADTPRPDRDQIAHGLKGNLCRCTGYSHILDAVQHAASGLP